MVKWRTPAAAIDWLTAKHFQPYASPSFELSSKALRLLIKVARANVPDTCLPVNSGGGPTPRILILGLF